MFGEALSAPGGMDRIRARMGVCPQFDILWNELTGREHLRIYGAVKVHHHCGSSRLLRGYDRCEAMLEILWKELTGREDLRVYSAVKVSRILNRYRQSFPSAASRSCEGADVGAGTCHFTVLSSSYMSSSG